MLVCLTSCVSYWSHVSPSRPQASDSAHITWESPASPSGKILEYSMYLAVRKTRSGPAPDPPGELAFIRIYRGSKTSCTVTSTHLSNAHIDCTARPALVFRIAAKNEQGYGPATQIRWLQGTASAIFVPFLFILGGLLLFLLWSVAVPVLPCCNN